MPKSICCCEDNGCRLHVELTPEAAQEYAVHSDWFLIDNDCQTGPEEGSELVKEGPGYKIYKKKASV